MTIDFSSFTEISDEIKFLNLRCKKLRSRLRTYQSNLDELLNQKAKYGISVPLSLINEIDFHQNNINETQEELAEIDNRVDELVSLKSYTPLHVGGRYRGVLVRCWNNEYRLPEYQVEQDTLISDIRSVYGEQLSALTWGYAGTGPHWTAYSILRDLVKQETAKKYHSKFNFEIIQCLPKDEDWVLTSVEILEWLEIVSTDKGLSE